MKYIVIPASDFKDVSDDTLNGLGLSPRRSIDGTEVLMKVDNYDKLFPRPMTLEFSAEPEEPSYPYPTYNSPSDEFNTLIASPEWTSQEDAV